MKALLILAHGSREQTYNDEIIALAGELDDAFKKHFQKVCFAFNQFAAPTFHEQVDRLVSSGFVQITIFPYFIAAGSHVLKDIPKIVDNIRTEYPDVDFRLTPHIGKFSGMKKLIMDEMKKYYHDDISSIKRTT